MTSRLTGRKFAITYTVWCLDVWGHGPSECSSSFNCPCVGQDDDGNEIHDPDQFNHGECDAEFTVNDRSKCGEIVVEADEDEHNVGTPHAFTSHHPEDKDIVQALIDEGLLQPHITAKDVDIEGESDDTLFLESSDDGRPLFQLEFESSIAIP